MSKRSVKANAFFNTLKEFVDLAAPLITFPYVTRVLMPDNLGKVQFATSIVMFFSYFASLGIPTYGVRKIAAVNDDPDARSKVFMNLLVMEMILTIGVYIVFCTSLVFVDKFNKELTLFLIMGIRIGLKIFGFEWFFKGMETFRFMAYRKLFAKIVGIILIFVFIKGPEDYILYGSISIITLFISQVLNFLNLKKMVHKVSVKELNLKKYVSGVFYFFLIFISTKIYNDVDKIMLGFISTTSSVSFYVTANKLINIIKSMFTAASGVLIPRMSSLIAKGKDQKFVNLVQKALSVIFFLPLPAMAGLYLLSRETVLIFGGNKYLPAVLTMRILLPVLILLPLKSLIGRQILLSYDQHKIVVKSLLITILFNVVLNAFLIPRFSQDGAAFASVVSEIFVIFLEIILGYKYIRKLNLNILRNYIYVLATLFMSLVIFLVKTFITNGVSPTLQIAICTSLGGICYFLFLLIARENLFLPMIAKMIRGKKGKK